jgi:hypothetical protein
MLEPSQVVILRNTINVEISKRCELIQSFARNILATSNLCKLQDYDGYVEDVFVVEYCRNLLEIIKEHDTYFSMDTLTAFIISTQVEIRREGISYESSVRVRSLHVVTSIVEDLLEDFTNVNNNTW